MTEIQSNTTSFLCLAGLTKLSSTDAKICAAQITKEILADFKMRQGLLAADGELGDQGNLAENVLESCAREYLDDMAAEGRDKSHSPQAVFYYFCDRWMSVFLVNFFESVASKNASNSGMQKKYLKFKKLAKKRNWKLLAQAHLAEEL